MRLKMRSFISLLRQVLFVLRLNLGLIPAFVQVVLFRNQSRIENRFNSISVFNKGVINSHIAVIAIYPEDTDLYLFSLKNLVDGLTTLKYTTIVVSNGDLPVRLKEFMNERKVIILKRKNYGRDFGAYKYGLLWIFENFNREKIESLILVNDTLNWPESSRRIITTAQGAQWGGMYLNLADNTHVNSFFMVFDGSVVNNKHFIKFWENYLPSQYKRHAIHKGEIRLSTTLLKAGFIPSVLVTALNLEESIAKLDRAKLLVLFDLPTVSIYPSSDHFFPQNEKLKILEEISEVKKLSTNELRREVLGHLLRHLYRDSPHSIGLHLFVLDLYPTKRDLYKYYPLSSIERALNVHSRFFSKLVIEDFEKTMTKRMIGLKKQKVMRTLGEA